jgi:maleate isomerase
MLRQETAEPQRIGVIVPSSNTVVEPDFARNLPTGTTLHAARMYLAETTEAAERRMIFDYAPQAVKDLASLYPQVVAFACTSGGAVLGAEGEAKLIEDIARSTGAQVVSTNDAVKAKIAGYRPDRIAVVTPYIDELNERIRAGLEGRGLNVVKISGMGLIENFAIAQVSPREILGFAEQQLAGLEFDLLFASCTNWRALEARPLLRQRFGVPVVTSNQATIEATLQAIGLTAGPESELGDSVAMAASAPGGA